jgi:glycosyltransferase involved in cell wall biosynthesis
MPQPSVSILMPAHNVAPWVGAAIASVQAQRFREWELILVNDASTDGTATCARVAALGDPRLRLIDNPRRLGAAQARNRALDAARGRYIAFLDADDTWHPDKLHQQIPFMQAQGAALSYTGFWRQTGSRRHHVRVPRTVTRDALLRGNVIGCLTAVYDTARLGKVPMPDLPMRHDFALWLDLLARSGLAHGLDLPLATHIRRAGSLSSDRLRAMAATWRVYRDHAGLRRSAALLCLTSHLAKRLQRG